MWQKNKSRENDIHSISKWQRNEVNPHNKEERETITMLANTDIVEEEWARFTGISVQGDIVVRYHNLKTGETCEQLPEEEILVGPEISGN